MYKLILMFLFVQKDCFEVYALVPGLLREEVINGIPTLSSFLCAAQHFLNIIKAFWMKPGTCSVRSGRTFGYIRGARAT